MRTRKLDVELVAQVGCACGENPLWHPGHQRLYWTDIPSGRLFWYDPATGKHKQCYKGPQVGGFTIDADGLLVLFRERGNIVRYDPGQQAVVATVIEEVEAEKHTRWNDVMADPTGRVYGGTMGPKDRTGRWYRIDTDGTLTVLMEGLGVPNGMGFSPDGTHLYFTHTSDNVIYRFDYDPATGELTDRAEVVKDPDQQGGHPDGMIVDAEGRLWSASFGGHGLYQYSASGSGVGHVPIPTAKITSLTLAPAADKLDGPLVDAYVTSAGGDPEHPGGGDDPDAGGLFRVRLGVEGQKEFRSRIRVGA